VKFSVARAVGVLPPAVMAAYGSVDFYEGRPTRDDIAVLGVVDHEVGRAGTVVIEVHYAFRGSVSPAVRRVVDPAKMSWITRTEIHADEGRGRATWTVLPDYYPDRLTAGGVFRFDPATTSSTTSTSVTVEGDLQVHVPIVGRSVERVIVAGLRRYIEAEVASIPGFMTRSGTGTG
jgi:Protein of unknown function (DUF2505)